jgi:hypothetical protein
MVHSTRLIDAIRHPREKSRIGDEKLSTRFQGLESRSLS